MKNAFRRWAYSFTITNIIFIVTTFFVLNRLNINMPYLRMSIASLLVALFVSLSITLFKMKKGNQFVKIILSVLALLPIIFILRRAFGVIIFRYSFILYILSSVFLLGYGIAVWVIAKKSKATEEQLNKLLEQKNKDDYEGRY